MIKLKPCPFCGEEAYLNHCVDQWQIGCKKCEFWYTWAKTKKTVVTKWNRRVNEEVFET